MAEIWLARQPGLHGFEKLVVIKRMVGALENDPAHIQMFLAEARLAAGLTHPNVVQIFELGEEQGSLFIVMEFIDGESLSNVWKHGLRDEKPLPGPMAAQIIAWSAEGLHYAHTRTDENGAALCIVHRDVSPQNLIITYDGSTKLVDFGIAKIASEATASGKLKGKLAYMAPEQGRAESIDARADVYSLGVVLFELITHTRLYPLIDELEIFKRLISGVPLPRAQERRADIPDALDRIISKAMALKREDRFESARAFQVALEDWLLKTGRRTTSAELADYMRSLFAARIEERRALIEASRKGELTPARSARMFSNSFSGKLPPVTGSAPGSESVSEDISMSFPAPRKLSLRTLGLGAIVVLGSVVLALVLAKQAREEAAQRAAAELIASQPVDAGPQVAAHSLVEFESKPSGAMVTVDGEPRGPTPVLASDLSSGPHEVSVSRAGFVTQKRQVLVGGGGERLVVAFELAEEPPAVIDAGAVVRPVKVAVGKLMLDTTPWTTVYLGNRKLGDTPLLGVSLPAGKQVLRLVNPEQNLNSSVEVVIIGNETTVKKLSLQ